MTAKFIPPAGRRAGRNRCWPSKPLAQLGCGGHRSQQVESRSSNESANRPSPAPDATLSANAYAMGDMFHGLGYAAAIFGKWLLVIRGRKACRPRTALTSSTASRQIRPGTRPRMWTRRRSRAHSMHPNAALLAKGPHIAPACSQPRHSARCRLAATWTRGTPISSGKACPGRCDILS